MINKRLPLFLTIIFATLSLLTLIACTEKPSKGEVAIGALFPLTGDAASYGEKGREAINLAVAQIKERNECGSHKLRVVFEDSKADPVTGVAAFRKLISADDVPVVIGDIVSAVTLAVAPVAESNQVLLLSPTSSAPAITKAGEYIYRTWPSDLVEGQAIAQQALGRGYRRASVVHLNNDYGVAIAKIFKRTFEVGGGRVISTDGYQAEDKDFRTLLTRIKTEHPDVIYIAGYFADTAAIIRQLRELGISMQVLGTTAVEDDQFLRLAGNAADGLIYPLATGFDASSRESNVKHFVDSFRLLYRRDPGWVEVQAYDAIMLICYALSEIKGDVTGTAIKKILDRMPPYNGVAGKIQFDENGDVIKPVVFRTIRNGKFINLEPAN